MFRIRRLPPLPPDSAAEVFKNSALKDKNSVYIRPDCKPMSYISDNPYQCNTNVRGSLPQLELFHICTFVTFLPFYLFLLMFFGITGGVDHIYYFGV